MNIEMVDDDEQSCKNKYKYKLTL